MTHRIRRVGHIQMCSAFYQILWRLWACIKTQTLETFSVITVQVRIFSGLDRNDLKYSLRICEICLFMNAKVLFLVICLASAILYVTRHLVIYEGLCVIVGRSRHEKIKNKKNKKERDPELNSVPHGLSNYCNCHCLEKKRSGVGGLKLNSKFISQVPCKMSKLICLFHVLKVDCS